MVVKSRNNHKRRSLITLELLLLILVLPSCTYLKQRLNLGEYSLKSAIKWAEQDSARVADSLNRMMAEKNTFNKTLTDSIMSLGEKSLPGNDIGSSYQIIIGSFANTENAKNVADQYSRKGYKTSMINGLNRYGDKIVMVSVKSFDNADEARSYLKEFKKKIDSKAWLYTN
jgi:hypothetical protein